MWVLILTLLAGGNSSIEKVQFKTQAACEIARDKFTSMVPTAFGKQYSAYQAICVEIK